jgi:hypothetical protein
LPTGTPTHRSSEIVGLRPGYAIVEKIGDAAEPAVEPV